MRPVRPTQALWEPGPAGAPVFEGGGGLVGLMRVLPESIEGHQAGVPAANPTAGVLRLVSNGPGASVEGNVRQAFTGRFSWDHKGFAASIEVTS